MSACLVAAGFGPLECGGFQHVDREPGPGVYQLFLAGRVERLGDRIVETHTSLDGSRFCGQLVMCGELVRRIRGYGIDSPFVYAGML